MFRKKMRYLLPRIDRYRYYNRVKILHFHKERGIGMSLAQKLSLIAAADRKILLPFIDIDITTYCNLRCRRCAKCIPSFEKHRNFSTEEIREMLDILTEKVDRIYVANIIGGEPFLNPDLADIIRLCAGYKKIGYLELTTNATVIPPDEVFEALRDSGVTVHVSNYPEIDRKYNNQAKLTAKLKEYGIPYEYPFHEIWLDFGDVVRHGQSDSELRREFIHCPMNSCTVYNDGKLYRCGKASYLVQHGKEAQGNDVIDLRTVRNREDMRRRIRKFYSADHLPACAYCEPHPAAIPAAEQI